MAKYGSFKYAADQYGADAYTETGEVIWIVSVDWDNDGVYDGRNEGTRLIGLKIKRGKHYLTKPNGKGFEGIKPGKATVKLNNFDDLYTTRNASSPLYDNLYPGRMIQIACVDTNTGTRYTLFTGIIMDIIPGGKAADRWVKLECGDYAQYLQDQEIKYQDADIKTTLTAAFTATLAAVQYPGAIVLDSDTQPIIVFDPDSQNGLDVCNDLAEAGLGQFFVARDGTAKYYSRTNTYSAYTSLSQSQCRNDLQLSQPWEQVYSDFYIKCHNKVKEQPSEIYFLPSPRQVTGSGTLTLYPAYPPSSGVQIDRYTGNSAEDGSGTDTTANLSGSATLGHSRGTVVASNSGATTWLTELVIRGRRWTDVEEEYTTSNATTLAKYGKKAFTMDTPYLQDINFAKQWGDTLKSFLSSENPNLIVQIDQRPEIMYQYDLLDVIWFTSAELGYSDDAFYIHGLDIEWNNDNGQDVTTTLYLGWNLPYYAGAITPAPVRIESMQAPPGYQNPGGDPGTIAATGGNFNAVCRLYGEYDGDLFNYHGSQWTVAFDGNLMEWGSNPEKTGVTTYIYKYDPEGMYSPAAPSRITIINSGTYLVMVYVNYYQETGDSNLTIRAELRSSGAGLEETTPYVQMGNPTSYQDRYLDINGTILGVFSARGGEWIEIRRATAANTAQFTIQAIVIRLNDEDLN